MRFTTEILDEIRSRVPVSQVAGRRVTLVRSGREWKGLSPFQHERTPSFTVNDAKQFFHCFSSGRHGDVFKFLMDIEGLSFPEAVEALAAEAGVDLPPGPAETRLTRGRRGEILDALDAAARFFQASLGTDEGEAARAFLAERGVAPETQARFGIGYAPTGWDRLRDHMIGMGFDDETLAEAGLVGSGERSLSLFDRFRDRITFPIQDGMGRVVGFGARALPDGSGAKYLNSPETPVFLKGRLLYNLHRARAEDAGGVLVMVEGYLDAVALDDAGLRKTVSTMGTALTRDQLAAAWRLCEEPVLLFDGDEAGHRAADRAIDVVLAELQPGRSVRIGLLPDGLDPDRLVRSGRVYEIHAAIAGAMPLPDALCLRTGTGHAPTPERRAAAEVAVRRAVESIRHPVVRFHYGREIDARIGPCSTPLADTVPRNDLLEVWALAVADARPDVAGTMWDAFEGAGLLEGGRLASFDPDTVPDMDAWAFAPEAPWDDVAALLGSVLSGIRRRSLLAMEAALDARIAASFAPCAPAP